MLKEIIKQVLVENFAYARAEVVASEIVKAIEAAGAFIPRDATHGAEVEREIVGLFKAAPVQNTGALISEIVKIVCRYTGRPSKVWLVFERARLKGVCANKEEANLLRDKYDSDANVEGWEVIQPGVMRSHLVASAFAKLTPAEREAVETAIREGRCEN